MIYFRSDYSQGAHPEVLKALTETNFEHTDGYSEDAHCKNAEQLIRDLCDNQELHVHMMVGGTPCNITTIAAALRPYEAVVAARTGHIYVHETGGVEGTGHRIITIDGVNGKLTPELIDKACLECEDEHTVSAKMVYISQPTEIGSIYSNAEMTAISEKCRERGMYLYVDGARLAAALTTEENDLSIRDLAALTDAFYIGGTKCGALFGEALVIKNPAINDHFRWMMKRQCGMLAKGRLIGVQFEALLQGGEDSLYYQIGAKENRLAKKIRDALTELGITFYSDSPTNQIFPIFTPEVVSELAKDFFFYEWAKTEDGKVAIRLVMGWGTEETDADAFISRVKELCGGN